MNVCKLYRSNGYEHSYVVTLDPERGTPEESRIADLVTKGEKLSCRSSAISMLADIVSSDRIPSLNKLNFESPNAHRRIRGRNDTFLGSDVGGDAVILTKNPTFHQDTLDVAPYSVDFGSRSIFYSVTGDLRAVTFDYWEARRAIEADAQLTPAERGTLQKAEKHRLKRRRKAMTRKVSEGLWKTKTLGNWSQNREETRRRIEAENAGPDDLTFNDRLDILRGSHARVHGRTIMDAAPAFRAAASVLKGGMAFVNDGNDSARVRFSIKINSRSFTARCAHFMKGKISHKELLAEGHPLRHTQPSRGRRLAYYDERGPLNFKKTPDRAGVIGMGGRTNAKGYFPAASTVSLAAGTSSPLRTSADSPIAGHHSRVHTSRRAGLPHTRALHESNRPLELSDARARLWDGSCPTSHGSR